MIYIYISSTYIAHLLITMYNSLQLFYSLIFYNICSVLCKIKRTRCDITQQKHNQKLPKKSYVFMVKIAPNRHSM